MLTISCKKGDSSDDPSSSGTVKDVDGNLYQTVKIGTPWLLRFFLTHLKNNRGAHQYVFA